MRIIITGGGTAGHINPALAIGDFIKNRHPNWDILYLGNSDHMEYQLATKAGYEFINMKVKGFQRKVSGRNLLNNFQAMQLLLTASYRARKIINKYNPDLIIGTGGYVTGPIINEAAKMGVKTLTHEQNAYPGVTTKLLSRKVDKVLLAVKEAKKFLDKNCDVEITGNPIRPEILSMDKLRARKKLNLKDEDICILSFGGSLGARAINETIVGLMTKTIHMDNIYHIHATGEIGSDYFAKLLSQRKINIKVKNWDIRKYINNMNECLAAADIVICRAGAITLSELEAVGKASLLIPSPNVAENHQYYNAKVLVDHKAAIMIEEKDLSDEKVYFEISKLISNKNNIAKMELNAKQIAVTDACEKIYHIVRQMLL